MDMYWIVGLGPFLVPLGAFAVAIVAIIVSHKRETQKRNLAAQERLALIARGMPLAELDRLSPTLEPAKDPLRGLAIARRTGIVLVSIGVGWILFFAGIAAAVQKVKVLSGAAIGFIPLAIGVGFFIDYHLQKRELSRFGMEIAADPPPSEK